MMNPENVLQSIETKILPCTNFKPFRIKATATCGKSLILGAEDSMYGYSDARNHFRAAEKLKNQLNWTGEMTAGATKDGFCFVFVPEIDRIKNVLNDSESCSDYKVIKIREILDL